MPMNMITILLILWMWNLAIHVISCQRMSPRARGWIRQDHQVSGGTAILESAIDGCRAASSGNLIEFREAFHDGDGRLILLLGQLG